MKKLQADHGENGIYVYGKIVKMKSLFVQFDNLRLNFYEKWSRKFRTGVDFSQFKGYNY
ncbi:MAG: hypothetical protein IJO98_00150 [Clostridia bacterium]|nr:hypothetical protein [Clostridia bacterium]